ncbi:MAG: hypothetical protein PVJ15_02005, partial [Gammaproteobacteria bacterium]
MRHHATTLLALWLLLACNVVMAAGESTFPDIQHILDAGTLRVAILAGDIPPLIMSGQDGAVTGSETDLVRD